MKVMMHATDNEPIEEVANVQIGEDVFRESRIQGRRKCISDFQTIFETKTYWCCTSHLKHLNTSKGPTLKFKYFCGQPIIWILLHAIPKIES